MEAGLLTSLKGMRLNRINIHGDLTLSLPAFDTVKLWRLSGDISQLLPLISCQKLWIYSTNLSSNATESLVNCLNTNVSQLELWGDTTVDISVLTQYDGTGKCQCVKCWDDSYNRYRGQVTQWAHHMRWKVEDNGSSWYGITIIRN